MPDTPAFLEAKRVLASELSDEIRLWSLSTMIEELQKRIQTASSSKHRIREFSRHCLGLHGEQFRRVREWLKNPSTLTTEDVCLVLRALKEGRNGMMIPPSPPRQTKSPSTNRKGVNRKLVGHAITMLNSLNILFNEAGIQPKDAFDGDRMQVQSAMEEICKRFGVTAQFSDPSAARNQPVTRDDLATIGLRKKEKRR